MRRLPNALFALTLLALAAQAAAAPAKLPCDTDIGGITLPAGFCATVFADNLGVARHMAMDKESDLYVALESPIHGGGIVMLRDNNGDGHADQVRYFGSTGGTGIGLHGGYLYFATDTAVLRYPLKPGETVPVPQTVVGGFPQQGEHAAKTIALDDAGHLYVNVGAPSNSCQEQDRALASPGIKPCPLLDQHAGIWRFDADRPGQDFGVDGIRYATGLRNAVAITWSTKSGSLYLIQMGRDQLSSDWPKLYTDAQSAELPGEEFLQVGQGADFGWPYCYYDGLQDKKVLAPEYGGDGKTVGGCDRYVQPLLSFPGHWAPEALVFYSGAMFPSHYQGGVFVSFHGSWNRAPLPQGGYKVVYVPFKDGKPAGPYEVFADGFAGNPKLVSPYEARYRPMGLAVGPDGALYIGDTQKGRIWRVVYNPTH